MAKLLTGYTGVNIFATDDQDLYKGIVGAGSVVFNFGGKIGLTVTASSTTVTATIADGAFSFNGRIVRVATAETVALNVPESGRYRKCEIVARYAKDSGTYVESVTLTPLYSSEDADTASGADALPISTTANDFPLYSFVYSSSGMEQSTKKTLFDVTESIESLRQRLNDVEQDLSDEVETRGDAVGGLDTRLTSAEGTLATTTAKADASRILAIHSKNGDGFDIVSGTRLIILRYWLNVGGYDRHASNVTVPYIDGSGSYVRVQLYDSQSSSNIQSDTINMSGLRLTSNNSNLRAIVCIG